MTEPVVHEMNNHTFRLAVAQFDRAAELMGLDHNLRQRLKMPDRSLVVSVPVRMDDGRVEIFEGYRVQHNLSTGPAKGGIRYAPDVTHNTEHVFGFRIGERAPARLDPKEHTAQLWLPWREARFPCMGGW